MSEEPHVPSLHLRPRLRPKDVPLPQTDPAPAEPGAPVETASNDTVAPLSDAAPRLRLKPRFANDAPESPPLPPLPDSTPAVEIAAVDVPVVKLGLRPRSPAPIPVAFTPSEISAMALSTAAPAGAPTAPTPEIAAVSASSSTAPSPMPPPLPLPPVAASPGRPLAPFAPTPPVVHIALPEHVSPESLEPAIPTKLETKGTGTVIRTVLAVAATLAILGGGVYAYRTLLKKPVEVAAVPPAAATQSKIAAPPVPALPTPGLVANPKTLPGKAIAKARDVIAAREKSGQADLSGVLDDAEPAAPSTATRATPPHPTATGPTPAPSTAASFSGGTIVRSGETPPAPAVAEELPELPPTPSMVAWADRLQIGGVFPGPPARALINGRMARSGEVVDMPLGLRFERVDAERKLLSFTNADGAVVTRKY